MSEDYKSGKFEDGSVLSTETTSVDGVLIVGGFFLLFSMAVVDFCQAWKKEPLSNNALRNYIKTESGNPTLPFNVLENSCVWTVIFTSGIFTGDIRYYRSQTRISEAFTQHAE